MKLKSGTDVGGIKPEIIVAMISCLTVVPKYGPFTITSIVDGEHKKGSLHPEGLAIDVRTRDMKPGAAEKCVRELQDALGLQYDVLFEGDHIHIEWDHE